MSEERIVLNLDDKNSVTVYLHGANITSWISNNEEILFLSKKAILDNKKAIRGGIPIVFPNFGPWDNGRPQHGFARTKRWTLLQKENKEDHASLKFSLVDDEETRKIWNHSFELIYNVVLRKNELIGELVITNKGSDEFDFTSLFHNYFRTKDISKVKIHGLSGLEYTDKANGGVKRLDQDEFIQISSELDRIYYNTANSLTFETGERSITLKKENFPDADVWNPWIEKAKGMADFDDEEYKEMINVQPGVIGSRKVLKPNETVSLKQTIVINQ